MILTTDGESEPCPAAESWRRLLIEDVSPAEREALEGHLGSCEACADTLMGLAGGSTLMGGTTGRPGIAVGGRTLAILARVASDSPEAAETIPPAAIRAIVPPEIPGLVDLEVVGRGGMGVVFRAREVELDRQVAVKVLSAGARLAPTARARAIREAMLMASLKHPNVVPVYRSGEVDGLPYLVMEWVEGGTLQDRIDAKTLSSRQAARTVRDLAMAVAEAHAMGIVHRDLKPENVLIAPSNGQHEGFVPKLTDFGLARRGEHDAVTETGLIIGTPGYMAPEQTGLEPGLGEVGPATDIHGLGAILFACLTGAAPYSGTSAWEPMIRSARGPEVAVGDLRRGLPRDLATIVDKCLQRSPGRRYRSASELAEDLGRFLEGRPIAARPTSAFERAVKWGRRHPAMSASAMLLVASMVAGVAGLAYHVAAINRNLRDLDAEQGRTKRALGSANAERDRANAELDLANQARDQTRRALASLTDGVVERIMQRGTALNEADRAFLLKVQGYYEEWPIGPDPEASLRFRIFGLLRIGDFFIRASRYDEAIRCFAAVISATDEAARRRIGGEWAVQERVYALNQIKYSHLLTKRPAEALAACRAMVATLEPLAVRDPSHRLGLARARCELAVSLAALDLPDESDALFRVGLDDLEKLRLERPADFGLHDTELYALHNAALAAENACRWSQAEVRWSKLVERARASRAAFPGRWPVLQKEIIGLHGIVTAIKEDRPAEAMAIHRRGMDLCREELAANPLNKGARTEFLIGAAQAFDLCKKLGHPGDAEADLERGIADGLRMMQDEPANFDRSWVVITALQSSSALFQATGRPRRAVEELDRLAAITEPWVKIQGLSAELVVIVVQARTDAARLLSELGEPAEAARRLAMSLNFREPKERPRVHLKIARLRLAAGDPGRAGGPRPGRRPPLRKRRSMPTNFLPGSKPNSTSLEAAPGHPDLESVAITRGG